MKKFLIVSGFCLALVGGYAQEEQQNGARPEEPDVALAKTGVSKGAPSQTPNASVSHNLFSLLQKEKSGWFTLVLAFLARILQAS